MAGGIWRAVHWWDQWQLRILVLGSLGVQWFLLFAAPMRKYTVPRWFRIFIWLAYIGSDALAIYALATLFNRHARGNGAGDSTALEVLWAPVLLIHLGGQEEITAYNIEDNELWTRHTVTLVSQVAVAVYAFCRSWRQPPVGSGDRRLLASAVLLFVIGILSFSEKPWAQRRACINRLTAVSSRVHGRGRRREVNRCQSMWNDLEDFVERCWRRIPMTATATRVSRQDQILSDADKVHMILSDMSLLAASKQRTRSSVRIIQVEDADAGSFASCGWWRRWCCRRRRRSGGEPAAADPPRDDDDDHVLRPLSPSAELGLKPWLRRAFGLIYTRVNVATTPTYVAYHMLLFPSLHVAAITLFATSDKRRYPAADVRITYTVLAVTAALDVLAETIRQLLYRLMSAAGVPALCETLPQYNVLSSARRRTAPVTGCLLRCAACLGLEEFLFVCCRRDESLYGRVAGFVMADLVGATTRAKGLDLGSYRTFTPANWALSEDLQRRCRSEIRHSLRKSFDESVLLWHVATDLCFRRRPPPAGGDAGKREECTRAVSDYMAHLLNSQPEMLMTGSRRHLLAEAVEDVESIIKDSSTKHPDEETLLRIVEDECKKSILKDSSNRHPDEETLLEIVREESMSEPPAYPLIHDAWKLSDELMELQDADGTGWEVMYRVWLGMLCYSASMCRGYLHAKSLGEGGEFLSFVWLVLSLKGAKTLADKLQMPEPDDQESAAAEETTAKPSIRDLESLVD